MRLAYNASPARASQASPGSLLRRAGNLAVRDREGANAGTRGRAHHRNSEPRVVLLNHAGFFERSVGAVFIDRLQPASRHTHAHEFFQLRHPNTMLVQVGREDAWHVFRDVPADAAFFLSHTTPMNHAASRGP